MTVNAKGLGPISTLIDLAITEYDLDGNPCTELQLPIEAGDQIERLPFNLIDLKRLFLKSPTYRNPPKVSSRGYGAAAFWIPLIGLFEGAIGGDRPRLIEDVKTKDGIAYFYITVIDDDDENGGTASSRKRAKVRTASVQNRLEAISPFWQSWGSRRCINEEQCRERRQSQRGRCEKAVQRTRLGVDGAHIADVGAAVERRVGVERFAPPSGMRQSDAVVPAHLGVKLLTTATGGSPSSPMRRNASTDCIRRRRRSNGNLATRSHARKAPAFRDRDG